MAIRIVTDSTAYLSAEILERYGIETVPLQVSLEDWTFHEGPGVSYREYYARMRADKVFSTTSQPSPGDFMEVFKKFTPHDKVICIHISELLSGTVQSAETAAATMPELDVTVFDSRSTVMGMGFQVLKAAEMAGQGEGRDEVIQELVRIRSRVKVFFVVDNLEYLVRSGRLGKASGVLGNLLQVKPILHVVDGRIEVYDKVRTKARAVDTMLNVLKTRIEAGEVSEICVLHVDGEAEAGALLSRVKELWNGSVVVSQAGPVVGSHVGPGTVGLVFY